MMYHSKSLSLIDYEPLPNNNMILIYVSLIDYPCLAGVLNSGDEEDQDIA